MTPLLRQVAHAPKPLWQRRGYGGQAGLDENLSMTRSGNTYYYTADGLASVRNILESDEDTANVYDYCAFGDALGTPQKVTAKSDSTPFLFPGFLYSLFRGIWACFSVLVGERCTVTNSTIRCSTCTKKRT